MIQISQTNLKAAADLHFEACENYILPRLDFYIDLFNSLGYHNYSTGDKSLAKRYGIQINSIQSIINPYLKSKYKFKKRFIVTNDQIISVLDSKNCFIIKDVKHLNKFKLLHDFFLLIKTNFEEIIKSSPVDIEDFILKSKYKEQHNDEIKKGLEKLFSYETLISSGFELNDGSSWNNYSITSKLNLSVCPYCNRNWINTVKDKITDDKITSPQLDHFFSKKDYPLFRLSFYNLIPSCETCNSRLKKDEKFELKKNIHPLLEGYGNDAKFKTTPRSIKALHGLSNDYSVELDTSHCNSTLKIKIEGSHEIFKINKIYSEHGDIIADIYRKRYVCSDKYLEILQKQFPKLGKSKAELYRFAFGNYYEEHDFNNRPFSKLTKDIASQLGLTC